MFKIAILFSSLLLASCTFSNSAGAASIVNGTFDTDLNGWSALTGNGSVAWNAGGSAELSTGAGSAPYSAVLVQGDDGLFNFASPVLLGVGDDLLKFDALFSSLGNDTSETAAALFSDNLQLWMYDANGLGDVLLATIDALTSSSSFSLDLSSYIGRSVAFSFELNDEDDGLDSRVLLDNVRLEQQTNPPVTVPEPGTLSLLILGAFGYSRRVSRNDRKVQNQIH
ncbi:PEP-CTERM sorting domain-containing protein [Methylomonas albis]|uniref:PEP-CTERM sorting domain-containing protein n=1 Tax=Methylomonas albis TaxID=1854563 RepID=A0ABR9D6W9_9GAMM|nr:PEP-CTERM sorting domain-containing protein [Methylomonas albis]MBD9358864.1 PEP-CTERM sorting domain-containing protein [Methylomonas albis]